MNGLKQAWKILKKLIFWLFFIGLFFVTVVTVILHIYEDDIKAYAIEELNSHLKTRVQVRNMEVTMFYDFPNTSLGFENVLIRDAFESVSSDDTMLFAQELYFHFNLLDIWRGDYTVKRASIHHGQINLKTTNTGDVNYNILKDEEDSLDSPENFKFLMDRFQIENIDFALLNRSTNQDYQIKINEGIIRGDFAATNFELEAEGDLHVDRLKSGSLSLINNKDASLALAMDINTEDMSYVFKKGDLAIDAMLFNVRGRIDESKIDLSIDGKNIQVEQLVKSVFPEENLQEKQYQGEGIVNFKGKVKGPLSRTEMPSIEADFAVENGAILEAESKLKIHSINLVGSYKNAFQERREGLIFDSFSFKLLNSYLSGNGSIRDFAQPELVTKAKGNLDLNAFHQFFGFNGVEELKGNVQFNLSCVMRFFDPEYRKDKFQIISSNGDISLLNIAYKGTDNPLRFTNITGDLLINEKDAAAKDLSIKTAKSDLLLNGAMKNFVSYLDGTGNLGLIASLESNHIDLDEFLGTPNKDKEGPLTMFELPSDINLNVELNLNKLVWESHTFNAISGQFLLSNREITVNQMTLSTLGGTVNGRLVLNNLLENGNIIDGELNFNSINVKNLFSEWKNFNQEAITDQHLSGRVSGNVNIILLFNPYFSIVEDQIIAVSNINIANGELNNLETMKAITDYMRSNKGLKLMLSKHIDRFEDKLMHLKFSELKNQIEIKDRKVMIPKMTISTNAVDVNLFGWHDFDNNIEYHFSFRFRQLKTKPEYTEFGKIEDDGLGIIIYLTMSGTIDDPVFSLDSDERKNDLKENMVNEKQNMKSMLKTEFGLFQRDTTIKTMKADNKKEVEFIFYDTDIDELESDTTKKNQKNKKRVGKFFDKLKEEAEKDK